MAFGISDFGKMRENIPREFVISALTFLFVPICFYLDVGANTIFQNTLGIGAWLCLVVFLAHESKLVRSQVAVAICFATLGEYFASVYMRGYVYQFENVPAFVPPGHGLVYLTAVVLARTGLFVQSQNFLNGLVLLVGSSWASWGLFFAPREDLVGFFLFLIFVFCLYRGPSPRVYLGAFFITSWLELVGTFLGTWSWAEIDPATNLTQGNPPSGVAAWYCLVDAVAISGAPFITALMNRIGEYFGRKAPINAASASLLVSLYSRGGHAITPVFALMLFL